MKTTFASRLFLFLIFLICPLAAQEVTLQVLGSGGPELNDGRTSSGYLIWVDGKARVLVDCGPGTARNFEAAEGRIEDVEAILLSHLHVDHSADLPAYVKGAFFTDRSKDLPVLGPSRSAVFPGTEEFVQALFGSENSAYPYLSKYLDGEASYHLRPRSLSGKWARDVSEEIRVSCVPVSHGPVPALAWRVDVGQSSVVFSGDLNGRTDNLVELAKDCDLLVLHNAAPESAKGLARKLHAPPTVLGSLAQRSGAGRVLLSHLMNRTSGSRNETRRLVQDKYDGPVEFAEELGEYMVPTK